MKKFNYFKFTAAIIIQLFLFLIISKKASNLIYNTKMSAGSHFLLAPFIFFKEIHSNSAIIESTFSLSILILNLAIIMLIAFIFTKITEKK